MEAKQKHLEFIQNTINRMAGNSFLLKGWAVTIVGGLLAFTFKEMNQQYTYISLVLLLSFWLLDSYYLAQERCFIKLYDYVRQKKGETDFSMKTKNFKKWFDWPCSVFSLTMVLFYGGLTAVHLIIIYYI